ncbi:E3 ubiquitin-protein ligase XIAP-like isoform X2 [Mercenaria mercenaria]|nr:E3 ubiquitin-protein ligase XIAP-like isoform X2 [Mercenaria mercenaria]
MLLFDRINEGRPMSPQYAVYAKRIESFQTWPEYSPVKKENPVEAGLVDTGAGDSVQCYFCGGGHGNGERYDSPVEEHAKCYPKCPYILLFKGQSYVEELSLVRNPDEFYPSEHIYFDKSFKMDRVGFVRNLVESVAAQSCLEMDFPKENVEQAIVIYCQRKGDLNFKAKDLCEILFEIEESRDQWAELIDDTPTPVLTRDFEDVDSLAQFDSLIGENHMCKMCMHYQEHLTLLAYHHLIRCPQCAPVLPSLQNFHMFR